MKSQTKLADSVSESMILYHILWTITVFIVFDAQKRESKILLFVNECHKDYDEDDDDE